MIEIPEGADGITARWLSSVLGETAGRAPEIASLEVRRIGEGVGVLSEIYRLAPRYAGDAGASPASLIVKIAPPIQPIRDLAYAYGFYEREATFYRDLAGKTPMRSPACYGAAYDPEKLDFVLVLQDLSSATPGDQIAGLTLDQLRAATSALAAQHARWWNKPELKALEGVAPPFGVMPYSDFNGRHGSAWQVMQPWLKTRISAAMMRVGERMCGCLDDICAEASGGPRTLCHGDFRADNLMFEPAKTGADSLIAIDWQIIAQNAGPFDLGYMMSGSVAPDLRREHEMSLLRDYHARLVAGGVADYDFDQCLHDYRRALLIGFTYCVQGGAPSDLTIPRFDALITGMAVRCEAAVQDHGLEEFLR
jgi:hypothetical protein